MAAIVHICPRYAPARGGVELFFEKVSEAAVADGHRVSVWTTDALTVRGFTQAGAPRVTTASERVGHVDVRRFHVRYVPLQRWVRTAAHVLPFGTRWKANTLRWTPWVPAMMDAAQAAGRLDLVHGAGLPYTSLLFAAVRLAECTGAKLVLSPFTHVAPPGAPGRVMRRAYLSALNVGLLRRADRVFVQTALERDTLAAAGVSMSRLSIIGLGVDAADCTGGDRDRARASWGVERGTIVIGHLANKSWDKGTIDLLQACRRLRDASVPLTLVLAGPDMPAFAAEWARTTDRTGIVNLPELTDDERRDFFAGIDVFALPSYVESFGVSSLEAAVNGAAIVAYDHGGPSQIFHDDVTALLTPAGDIDRLTDALRRIVMDIEERQRLASAAQALARSYTWARALDAAMTEYRHLLSADEGA